MKWLIRRVVKRGKGAVQYEEEIHFGDVLSLGRAANQAIFLNDLRAALEHATVTAIDSKRFRVDSQIAAGVRVNGHIEQSCTIRAGGVIEIGSTRITLIDAPEGYEAAVEIAAIDKDEMKAREDAGKLPTALSETWLSRRTPSWILFLVTLTIGLLLPMTMHFFPGLASATKDLPIPGRGVWESGELGAAHHYFGQDCQMCHEQAFEVVKDSKCMTCHAATAAHADPHKFPMYELADARCAHCHRDHNGPDGLVLSNQSLCSDCHSNLKERTNNASTIADVADFGKVHPQFYVNLPAWDAAGQFKPVRTSLENKPLTENSGLKFPHEKHLGAVDGLQSPTGKRDLSCDSCHQPEAGGAIMKPVDFESMCQDCHRLTFDRNMPDRQVPHADVAEVLYRLNEFYARAALDGTYGDQAALPQTIQRRRPGQVVTPAEKTEITTFANRMSRQKTDSMFQGNCAQCHTVTPNPGADFENSYVIAPVRVAGVWYAKASFTHGKHVTMECSSCHAAEQSKSSADLLIPGIDNCQKCHAGEGTKGLLSSTCIDCHGFHQAPFLLHETVKAQAAAKSVEPTPVAPTSAR
jgi:hypothetical protein